MSEGIQAPTHDERVAELQAERDAARLALAKMLGEIEIVAVSALALVENIRTGTECTRDLCFADAAGIYSKLLRALADPAASALAAEAREMRAKAEALDAVAAWIKVLWDADPVDSEIAFWWDGEKFGCCLRPGTAAKYIGGAETDSDGDAYVFTADTLREAIDAARESDDAR